MGLTVSTLKATLDIFERAKPILNNIPSNYADNFHSKYKEVLSLKEKADHENKTIYFEKEIPID